MSTEHHLHGAHAVRPAHGSGGHDHRRATMERAGVRVGYWECSQGVDVHRSCPSEPDPVARLIVKLAERSRVGQRVEAPWPPAAAAAFVPEPEVPCPRDHDPSRMRVYLENGRRVRRCLECRKRKRST